MLNTETWQWHTAPDLPEPLSGLSLTLCDDLVYIMEGHNDCTVYSSSLNTILLSAGSNSLAGHLVNTLKLSSILWNRVADLPVTYFHCQVSVFMVNC